MKYDGFQVKRNRKNKKNSCVRNGREARDVKKK